MSADYGFEEKARSHWRRYFWNFFEECAYMDYAEELLDLEQGDDIDEALFPGYSVSA